MKVYSYHEIESLPEDWIEAAEALPPAGVEVIVETYSEYSGRKVKALARFDKYENCPANESFWDNSYGRGNTHTLRAVVRWRPMPKLKEL